MCMTGFQVSQCYINCDKVWWEYLDGDGGLSLGSWYKYEMMVTQIQIDGDTNTNTKCFRTRVWWEYLDGDDCLSLGRYKYELMVTSTPCRIYQCGDTNTNTNMF